MLSLLQEIERLIQGYPKLSQELYQYLFDNLKQSEFPKNHRILNQGEICRNVYFLENGLIRQFINEGNREVNTWFSKGGEFMTSMASFLKNQAATESIQTIEKTKVYWLSYDKLQEIYLRYPEFNLVGRLLIEKYYLEQEQRILMLQNLSAKEKIDLLMTRNPWMFQRIPLNHLASYLGITKETLSRLRSDKHTAS